MTDSTGHPPTHREFAVLGSPIDHSLSPTIHSAVIAEFGIDAHYGRHEVDEATFPEWFAERGPEWGGLSLTMPLKRVALDVVDECSEVATRVGAANTIWWRDGRSFADNTDVPGIVEALRERLPAADGLRRAMVIGAGATAGSVIAALAELGLHSVVVLARRPQQAEPLVRLAADVEIDVEVGMLDSDELPDLDVDLVTSTVPGTALDPRVPESLIDRAGLFDVAYSPWPTPLARRWYEEAAPVVGGADMLIHQAIEQQRRFWPDELAGVSTARLAEIMRGALAARGR